MKLVVVVDILPRTRSSRALGVGLEDETDSPATDIGLHLKH